MDIRHVEEFMRRVAESETKTFPAKGKLKVGLDLGTAYIVIVVLDEENQPVACEKQAAGPFGFVLIRDSAELFR